jgi:hypothetical protein
MDTRAGADYAASWTTEGTRGGKTVTEAEWLACNDPVAMLEFLWGKTSDRKLRLFAVACCRQVWHLMTNDSSRQAFEVMERFVDGEATNTEVIATVTPIFQHVTHASADYPGGQAAWAIAAGAGNPGGVAAGWMADWAIGTAGWLAAYAAFHAATQASRLVRQATRSVEEWLDPVQADLLRDIFGNPFGSVALSPAALGWNNALVVRLAQAAYDERQLPAGTLDSGRFAVLADALEEAGCTDADILGHLRGSGPHVRGCWPVDLCLGKS